MSLFGTDGLRGRAGLFPLDPDSVFLVGRAVGQRLQRESSPTRVVLGGDTRESTPALMDGLASGLAAAGCQVARAGVLTTPGVAEVVLALGAGAGISVSASHNPFEDNGIKIFGSNARKWPDAEEKIIERSLLEARGKPGEARRGDGSGTAQQTDPRLAEIYLSRLAEHMPVRLNNMYIVADAGHGAAYRLGPAALTAAGARVRAIHDSPDGKNINRGCGALYPESMAAATRTEGAALGIAWDGDADRAILADETGRILDGDDVLWIIATDWKRKGILSPAGVVGTVMSNLGLETALRQEGIPFGRASVGDRHVARLMEESGATLGGETSGHILLPFSPAGDGILTALLVASIVAESGRPISELATLEKVPQLLRNVPVGRRVSLDDNPAIAGAIAKAREALDQSGRVFVRYSGTEALLRILVEGSDGGQVTRVADELEAAIVRELA